METQQEPHTGNSIDDSRRSAKVAGRHSNLIKAPCDRSCPFMNRTLKLPDIRLRKVVRERKVGFRTDAVQDGTGFGEPTAPQKLAAEVRCNTWRPEYSGFVCCQTKGEVYGGQRGQKRNGPE
jgi:hypothetical protein